MLGNDALYSRFVFVFALVCAAVMSCIVCSDAARASPLTTQVDSGVKYKVLKKPYTPHSQNHLFTGLPSMETGRQTGYNGETERNWNYREALSDIKHQSNPAWFTEGSFSSNQNSPDNRQPPAAVQRGARPASSYQPLSPYTSYPRIIRKSSHKEAAGPFHRSSAPLQVWDSKDAQKSDIVEKVPRNNPPPLFSSQTDRHWSASLPNSRGQYSSFKETNELTAAGVRSTSSGIQSGKFLSFPRQTAPHAPSISSSLDASVIKRVPSPEKPTSSITDFSRGLHSVSGSETPKHKKVQSYQFKDSQNSFSGREKVHAAAGNGPTAPHKQRASDVRVYSRFSQRKEPIIVVQHANPLYHNVAQHGAQTDSFTRYQHGTQLHPAPGKGSTMGNFVPTPHADFQDVTGGDTSVRTSLINPTGAVKSIYGFRGFENPTWRAAKEPSNSGFNEQADSRRYNFQGRGYKVANVYPSLSPKYSFGQRKTSTSQAKPRSYPSPSPRTRQGFTSGSKEARALPESDGVDRNPHRRRFKISKRIYGLKGFGTQPVKVSETEESAKVQQGFEGFKQRSSQIWQPKSTNVYTLSRKELSSEDLKPPLKTTKSSFTPDEYKKKRKIYTSLGFLPSQNRISNTNKEPNPASHIVASSYFSSAGKPQSESSPTPEPRAPNKTKPVVKEASLHNSSTSSTVKGRLVKANGKKLSVSTLANGTNAAIVRLPKRPAKVITITYADVLGSASFSGVTATTQTPITPADKDYSNSVATTLNPEEAGLSGGNTSKGPPDAGGEVEDVEENKLGVRREEVDMKVSDLFLDNEGSGSGDYNISEVLSKTRGLSEDLAELDYLRISTGNISFTSMKLPNTET